MEPLTAIPAQLQQGDSTTIRLTRADYPASTWTGVLALVGVTKVTLNAVPDGDVHVFTLTRSAGLTPGPTRYALTFAAGDSRVTTETGVLTVQADVSALAAGEGQSWAEKTLAVVEAVLTNTATGEMKMYMIGGRQVHTHSLAELMKLRSQLRDEVTRDRNGGRRGAATFVSRAARPAVWE